MVYVNEKTGEIVTEKLFVKNEITNLNNRLKMNSDDIETTLIEMRDENQILIYSQDIDKKKLTKQIDKAIKAYQKAEIEIRFLNDLFDSL